MGNFVQEFFLLITIIMATEWQNPPDADVILRAPGGKEFHAHKLVLSLASSVFRDMLSIPQISTDKDSSKLPIIDVDDPPETLEIFLQIIYPIRNTPIDNLETLATVLKLADKYDAKALLDKDYLPSTYASSPPIHMYAISCAYGREKEAEVAARRAPLASLELLSPPLLQLMTLGQYHQLMKFMVTRDKKMRDVLDRYRSIMPINCTSKACQDALNQSYLGTIVASDRKSVV